MTTASTTTTAAPRLRWSSVRDCARKAVYEAQHAPHRDRSEREERILWRGRSLGAEYARFLRSKYGDEQVLTEVEVDWPLGTGHMDAYIKPTRTAIEVLSSAHASDVMMHSKLLQLVGYIEHANPDLLPIDAGALVVLDPSDFTDEVFPLARTSRVYRDLVQEMAARVGQVQAWAADGTVPARVCTKPSESRSHFCLYAEHCFDGWEKPDLPVLDDPAARDLVADLYQAKRAERDLRATLAAAETARKEIEQRLDDLVPVGKHQCGPLELTRTHIERKPTFQWEKAETAGVFNPDAYLGFFKAGATYDVFRVDRVSDEPIQSDDRWGDVPFTGDERDAA